MSVMHYHVQLKKKTLSLGKVYVVTVEDGKVRKITIDGVPHTVAGIGKIDLHAAITKGIPVSELVEGKGKELFYQPEKGTGATMTISLGKIHKVQKA